MGRRSSEAVAFYEAAFGATVLHRVGDGNEIVAQLAVGDAAFWVAPTSTEMRRLSPRAIDGATSRTLHQPHVSRRDRPAPGVCHRCRGDLLPEQPPAEIDCVEPACRGVEESGPAADEPVERLALLGERLRAALV